MTDLAAVATGVEVRVDVNAIEKSLTELWRGGEAKDDHALTRAALWNVVAHTTSPELHTEASEALAKASAAIPQRTIIVRTNVSGGPELASWISANCHLVGGGKQVCSEEITLPTLRQRVREEPGELALLVSSILFRLDPAASGREERMILEALERGVGRGYRWPGNVRELEQAVKRVILTGRYEGREAVPSAGSDADDLAAGVREGTLDAGTLLGRYCATLYRRHGSYEEVARRTRLDRRTVRKYILSIDTPTRL